MYIGYFESIQRDPEVLQGQDGHVKQEPPLGQDDEAQV